MSTRWYIRGGAIVAISAPIVTLAIIVAIPNVIYSCLGGVSCGEPPPIPEAVEQRGMALSVGLVISASLGILASIALAVHVARVEPRRFMRILAATALLAGGAALVGFVAGVAGGLRKAAEDGVLFGIGGAGVAAVLFVAWAAVTVQPKAEKDR